MYTKNLDMISKWGKFLGYVYIIVGALYAVGGLFAFIVGAIPGVIMIFLGLFILRSARAADQLKYQFDEVPLQTLLENYGRYLQIQGIMMIIGVVVGIIGAVIALITGFALFDSLSGYDYY